MKADKCRYSEERMKGMDVMKNKYHWLIPDDEIPVILKRKLRFGDLEQLEALNILAMKIERIKFEQRGGNMMICEKCINLEVFGRKESDEWFNRCPVFDLWNMKDGDQCEFFSAVPDHPPPSVITLYNHRQPQ